MNSRAAVHPPLPPAALPIGPLPIPSRSRSRSPEMLYPLSSPGPFAAFLPRGIAGLLTLPPRQRPSSPAGPVAGKGYDEDDEDDADDVYVVVEVDGH
jgi:hypothetical protein